MTDTTPSPSGMDFESEPDLAEIETELEIVIEIDLAELNDAERELFERLHEHARELIEDGIRRATEPSGPMSARPSPARVVRCPMRPPTTGAYRRNTKVVWSRSHPL